MAVRSCHLRELLLRVEDLDEEGQLVVHDGEAVARLHEEMPDGFPDGRRRARRAGGAQRRVLPQ